MIQRAIFVPYNLGIAFAKRKLSLDERLFSMKKKLTRSKKGYALSYACAFLLMAQQASAFDSYAVDVVNGHYVITIDKCSYRERLQRNKTGYETKDVVRRALQACKKA